MSTLPKKNFVLLETNRFDKDNHGSFLFSNPTKIIACDKLSDVKNALCEIEDYVSKGYYAAGFISYEAGFSFEESLNELRVDHDFPLLWFGIYKKPKIIDHKEKMTLLRHKNSPYSIENLRPNISKKKYVSDIEKIKDFIRRGETYQVNYTFKYRFDFKGSACSLYEELKKKQSVSYSSLIKTDRFSIVSLSPELFFRKHKDRIEVKPMKGTIDRGKDLDGDREHVEELGHSLKNRSENLMIVDLLRNDLGRISKPGKVVTKKLFEVEKYETLFQMVSIVKAILKKRISIYDLLKAIFPSGSVTGAPKINTMKIINFLEREPRRVYTGSIGFFAPDGDGVFNVVIRTILIDNKRGSGEMGIGSGIVYDSDPYKEFDECELKADFIRKKKNYFKFIETILWRPKKGYFLLNKHLNRLLSSAEYFNVCYDKKAILKELKDLEKRLDRDYDHRVRLLFDEKGRMQASFTKINGHREAARVRFSEKKVRNNNIFLYHKTTSRDLYDEEHEKWRGKGYFDIIFTNKKDEVTEGAISNILIRKGRFYYTPPVDCGLLNGVFRRHLIETKKIPVKEKVLRREDILSADEVFMMNSVRGMVKVVLDVPRYKS